MKGAEETLDRIKELGCTTAIISGGLQILADRIKDELGMDYAFANRLLFDDGKVSGIDQLVDFASKGGILRDIAAENDIDLKECVAVGDYINDIPLFKAAGFGIAFNPKDEEILKYVDAIVYEKDLRNILQYIEDGV